LTRGLAASAEKDLTRSAGRGIGRTKLAAQLVNSAHIWDFGG